MPTITIQRTKEYNNGMRDYKIFIDGQQAGKIANGETEAFEVTAGQHTVTAKIDWCSSPDIPIDIKEHENRNLKVGGFKNSKWIMPLAGGIIALHFILVMTINVRYAIFLLIPVFPIIVYYLTLGRKKYLSLGEIV